MLGGAARGRAVGTMYGTEVAGLMPRIYGLL